MIPAFIASTVEFERIVQLGSTPESLILEFKGRVDGWDILSKSTESARNGQKEVCRDIAQFANTFGGCVLVGITERFDPARGAAELARHRL